MFAKLKQSKFFKSLSGIICSIELVETEKKTRAHNHHSHLPASSDSRLKDADKATHPVP